MTTDIALGIGAASSDESASAGCRRYSGKPDPPNRLSTALSFTNLNTSTNTWGSGGTGIYANNFTYDANGNILTQLRKNESAAIVDSLRYFYQKNSAGKTVRNRLYHVHDDPSNTYTYPDDIDDMGTYTAGATINGANNFVYDEEGRLIKDVQSGILQITWRVDSKVKEIKRYSESGANMRFDYDAMGHRIAKHIYTEDFTDLIESTYYILDANGNVMSTYQRKISSPSVYFTQREKYIYGSTRVGVLNDSIALLGSQNATYSQSTWNHVIGKRNYELQNHLGNVLSVISDKPIPHTNGSVADFFLADIRQATDYSGFGVQLSGRNFTASSVSKKYRMGYQGSEMDNEVKGDGNSYTTEFRQLDPRLGRWLAMDPMIAKFPWQSPYCSMDNNPVCFNDPAGDEVGYETKGDKRRVGFLKLISKRFREAHAYREAAAEMYIYRHKNNEPPLVGARPQFELTVPIVVDAGKEARYDFQDQYGVLYDGLGIGIKIPEIHIPIITPTIKILGGILKLPVGLLSGVVIGTWNLLTFWDKDVHLGWGMCLRVSTQNDIALLGYGFGNYKKYNMFGLE